MPGTQLRGSHAGPVLELALNSAVRELRLMGPGDQVVGSVGISARRSSALVLEDVTIWNTSAGLDLEQCWYAHLVMCSFWHNATAVRIEYCNNVSAHGVRISGLLADGSGNGVGIEMLDRSMLTIHGGAIEQYRTGISLGTSMSVTLFGTYMETRTGGVSGVRVDGIGASVVATGGQVYVMNQAAWIDFTPGSGERQVASGNKFRGGIAGQQVLACRWHPASHDRLRVSVTSDSWHDVVPDEAVRHHSEPLPTASLVETPAPPPGGAGGLVTSTQPLAGTGQMWTSTGSGRRCPQLGSTEPELGAQFFDTVQGRPLWWDGRTWVDALGEPADGMGVRLATAVPGEVLDRTGRTTQLVQGGIREGADRVRRLLARWRTPRS
ncbi:hypothetical protein [Luteococcus sp.]|uniref:hypothetical protein n=1 Tax=Luteococcus sp. TaxID=1969402 RepID=UPI0037353A5B